MIKYILINKWNEYCQRNKKLFFLNPQTLVDESKGAFRLAYSHDSDTPLSASDK